MIFRSEGLAEHSILEFSTSPQLKILWNIRDWVDAIAQLPAQGPLATRTVLVHQPQTAHVLRRGLIRAGMPAALAGTRFLPVSAAAGEVLQAAGVGFEAGEGALRSARLLALLWTDLPPRAFFPLICCA
jgi:hypothetical protein